MLLLKPGNPFFDFSACIVDIQGCLLHTQGLCAAHTTCHHGGWTLPGMQRLTGCMPATYLALGMQHF